MEFAVTYPNYIKGAIVVDLAPYNYLEDKRFDFIDNMYGMMERLTKINLDNKDLTTLRKEVVSVSLSKEVGEVIATNLVPDEKGGYMWRINLQSICKNLKTQILNLDYTGTKKYNGPVRIICGDQSEYMKKDIVPSFHKIFGNLDEERDIYFIKNSGHWVHYSQPHEFINLVSDFLDKVENNQ